MVWGREVREVDTDFNGKKAYGPATPVGQTDVMRLQDVAVGAGILKSPALNTLPLTIAVANADFASPLATYVVRSAANKPPNAQDIAPLGDGVLRQTVSGGLATLALAIAGTHYQAPIAAGTGIRIPDGFTIYAKLSEGVAGGQSAIGGQSASDNLTLSSTTNATKGLIVFGSTAVASLNEATKNFSVGAAYNGSAAGRLQVWATTGGQSGYFSDGTASAVLITHPSSSLAAIAGGAGVGLNLGANGTLTYLQIGTAGNVTATSLAGSGTALVRATSAGLLQRAAAGTDFPAADATYVVRSSTNAPTNAQNIGTLADGLLKHSVSGGLSTIARAIPGTDFQAAIVAGNGIRIPDGVTINSTLVEGKAGGQTVIGGTAASENLTFSSTTNATKGLFVWGSAAVASLNEATKNLALGAAYSGAVGGRLQVTGATAGTSAAFTDGTASAIVVSHPSSSLAAISAMTGVGLNLGAGGATTFVQIATAGGVTLTSLSGTGTVLVAATSTGLLQRAVAGTDFPPPGATYWVSSSTNAPVNAVNLGLLTTGLVKIDVTGSVATPSTAIAGVDYPGMFSLTNRSVVVSGGGSTLTQDNSNFVYDTTNHRLVLALAGAYTPAAGAPLTISATGDAIMLNASGTTGITKTNGALVLGTDTGHDLLLKTGATVQLTLTSAGALSFGNGDAVLVHEAAGVLAQRSGATKQGHFVYNTFTSATNYERGVLDWTTTANVLTIGAQKGSGGGTLRAVDLVGSFIRVPAGDVTTPGLVVGADGSEGKIGIYHDTSDRLVIAGAGGRFAAFGGPGGDASVMEIDQVRLGLGATSDIIIFRDAAGTLGLLSPTLTVPQGLVLYKGSNGNYERAALAWSSNEVLIGTQKSGTGTLRWVRATGAGWNFFANAGTFSAPTVMGINLATTYANVDGNTLNALSIPATTVTVTGATATNTNATGVNMIEFGAPTYAGSTTHTINQASTIYVGGAPAGSGGVTITRPYGLHVVGGVRSEGKVVIGNNASTGAVLDPIADKLRVFSANGATQIIAFNGNVPAIEAAARIRFLSSPTATQAGDIGMNLTSGRPNVYSQGTAGGLNIGVQGMALDGDGPVFWGAFMTIGTGAFLLPFYTLPGASYPLPGTTELKFNSFLNLGHISIKMSAMTNTLNGTVKVSIRKNGTTVASSSNLGAGVTGTASGVTASISTKFVTTDDISFAVEEGTGTFATTGSAWLTFSAYLLG